MSFTSPPPLWKWHTELFEYLFRDIPSDCWDKILWLFPNCTQAKRPIKQKGYFWISPSVGFDLDLHLVIVHVKPVAGFVSVICCTSVIVWQEKWARHGHKVCKKKNDFEGSEHFQGWTTRKVICLCVYCCILPAIKETLFIPVLYNWALMIEHRMRPPVGSEMEIWEDTNAMREIYGSHLKLIDPFRLR